MSDVKKNPNVKKPLPLHIHNVPNAPNDSPVNHRFTILFDMIGVERALSHNFNELGAPPLGSGSDDVSTTIDKGVLP
jgi:hypothetical protein